MVHGMDRAAAAHATAAAWFPLECAATPRRAASSESAKTALTAPRSLNEPAVVPGASRASTQSDRRTGVRSTRPRMRTAASCTAAAAGIDARPLAYTAARRVSVAAHRGPSPWRACQARGEAKPKKHLAPSHFVSPRLRPIRLTHKAPL
eukprot:scaffold4975_cov112-Isochrysis_galbana.AAC.5